MFFELYDGSIIEMDSIFIECSNVISNFVKDIQSDYYFPLIQDYCYKETLDTAAQIIRYLQQAEFENIYALVDNLDLAADLLNLSEFLDIPILRSYLIDYFALIIKNNSEFNDLLDVIKN